MQRILTLLTLLFRFLGAILLPVHYSKNGQIDRKEYSFWFPYLLFSSFILGWWMLAFHPPTSSPSSLSMGVPQSLALKTSALFEELSPLQRDALQRALAGHFPLMLDFINQWDQDAQLLANQGVEGIQRLPADTYLQAHILGHLLCNSSKESLRQLNCKMNLEWMQDDGGHLVRIEDSFRRFLPQTYVAASFLLAIADPSEIIALPKGLRQLPQLYSTDVLARVPNNIDRTNSEKLYLNRPDLAFVAPYSHPPALEVLRNQNIQLYSIKYVNSIAEVQEALLKVGHASNHILEAQLLAIFIEACMLSIDNRLHALQTRVTSLPIPLRLLYLSYHQHFMLPTSKCLTGQLLARALKHCPYLSCPIPESQEAWRIPFEHEKIVQAKPDCLIISTLCADINSGMHLALQQTKAFQSQRIFYLDEAIQESPTQYIALAYFDIFQALAAAHL
jgi:iron complex transport system substrate-binding protein